MLRLTFHISTLLFLSYLSYIVSLKFCSQFHNSTTYFLFTISNYFQTQYLVVYSKYFDGEVECCLSSYEYLFLWKRILISFPALTTFSDHRTQEADFLFWCAGISNTHGSHICSQNTHKHENKNKWIYKVFLVSWWLLLFASLSYSLCYFSFIKLTKTIALPVWTYLHSLGYYSLKIFYFLWFLLRGL